jgi:hypothetical protein
MSKDTYKQNTTDTVFATFSTAPDATPTLIALNSAGATDATITFGTVTGSNNNLTYSSLMTIDAATPVGAKDLKWSAVFSGTTHERFASFYVTTQLLEDLAGVGTGNFEVTVNVKDQFANNVQGVQVTVHNAADDDDPLYGPLTTDASGDAVLFMLSAASYTVRGSKAGFSMSPTAITVTGTSTKNVTGTTNVIPNPVAASVCRLFIYPVNLDNTDVKNLVIYAQTKELLSKSDGEFITNKQRKFTYNSSTTPDSYYYDAIQGETILITSLVLGLDKVEVDVPALSQKDLADLIDE